MMKAPPNPPRRGGLSLLIVGADWIEGQNKLSRCGSPRRTLAVSFFCLRGCISAICTYYGLLFLLAGRVSEIRAYYDLLFV